MVTTMRTPVVDTERCKAEEGVLGTILTRPCPNPALPGEDYCPLHLVLVKRLED
jgi:hypothetical protein